MIDRKFRVAVVNSHPIQYFAPLYAYVNRSPDIEMTAIYLSDFSIRGGLDKGFGQVVKWDIDLLSGYPYQFVRRARETSEPTGFTSIVAPDLWSIVRKGGFDALLLHGHNLAAYHLALAAAKASGMLAFMRCDAHPGIARHGIKRHFRKSLLGAFYRSFDGFLAIGTLNREYYLEMGAPADKISIMPFAVDNDRISRGAKLNPRQRNEVRARLGLSGDRPAVLYASKFQRRKHPDDLVRAAQKLARQGLEFDLVMAGSGEMEAELRALVVEAGLQRTVFPGFVNQQDLPGLLGACDIFVLPAEDEPWGLIVNEAMCAGLPIVLGSELGCVPDLLDEGRNGASFKAGDVDALAAALGPIVADAELRSAMSVRSREIIDGWSYRECLEDLRRQVRRLRPELRMADVANAGA